MLVLQSFTQVQYFRFRHSKQRIFPVERCVINVSISPSGVEDDEKDDSANEAVDDALASDEATSNVLLFTDTYLLMRLCRPTDRKLTRFISE